MIHIFRGILHKPYRIFLLCGAMSLVTLVLDGTLYRYWSLNSELGEINERIRQVKFEVVKLEGQILQSKDPKFIEKQALERFDFVEKDDLVFIFSNE